MLSITMAQLKSHLGDVEGNFETAEKFIRSAEYSDVVVLPELWNTGYFPTPLENYADKNGERTSEFISNLSRELNLNIVAGSVAVEVDGKFYNRCLVSNRKGEIVAAYDKTHLFTFAGEEKVFTAGDKIVTVEIDGVKCGLSICYDLRFPEFIRKLALQGVEILFVPAAWSLLRLMPRQILTKARAIENQIFVVFVNSLGRSEIINPLGVVLGETGINEQNFSLSIDLETGKQFIKTMNLLADRNLAVDDI